MLFAEDQLHSWKRWSDQRHQALENVPGDFYFLVNARLADQLLVQECAVDDDSGLLDKLDRQRQIFTKGPCAIGFKRVADANVRELADISDRPIVRALSVRSRTGRIRLRSRER